MAALNKTTLGSVASMGLLGSTAARATALTAVGVGGVVAGVGLLGAASVGAAIKFESSFAGVRKTVDATEAEFAQLEQGFLDLSKTIPVSVNELNRIGELGGQLGIQNDQLLSFTETIAQLGVTTNLTVEEAATQLARLANVTGLPQEQFDNLGSAIVALGNNFATTEAEITEFGQRIAGAGSILGLTEAEILAIGAAMSSIGVEAEAGGTAVQKVLLAMQKSAQLGGKQLDVFAGAVGTTAEGFRELLAEDPNEAFTRFVEGLNRIEQSGGSTQKVLKELGLTDSRLTRAFLGLANAGDLLRRTTETSTKAFADNNALQKEAATRFATTESQLQLFRNNLNAIAIILGSKLLPAFNEIIGSITGLLKGLSASGEAASTARGAFDTLAAVVTPFVAVVKASGPIIADIFRDIGQVVRDLTPTLKILGAVVGGALVVAFTGFVATGRVVVTVWQAVAKVIKTVTATILAVVDDILSAFSALADAASHIPFVGDQFAGVADKINAARDNLRNFTAELDVVDGKTVSVDFVVRRREEGDRTSGTSGGAPESGAGAGTDDGTGDVGGPDGNTVVRNARAEMEARLQANLQIAQLQTASLADDRAALQALIAFYAEAVAIQKRRGEGYRRFLVLQLQAQDELKRLNQGAADAAKQAADDAKRAADERAAAALSEQRAVLDANVRLAALTEQTLADDRKAFAKLIAFLKQRVDAAKNGSAAQRQALIELRTAQQEQKDLLREAREARVSERESLLEDNVTLAGFTESKSDDERALKELAAFYKRRIRDLRLSKAERRKYRIALAETKRDIRELRGEEKGVGGGDEQGTSVFELLSGAAGRFSEIAGNLTNADQPFAEVSDFLANQASQLTRTPARTEVSVTARQKGAQRDRSIELLIEALDRNTEATTGNSREGRGASKTTGRTGAVEPNDKRWRESRDTRAMVEGAI